MHLSRMRRRTSTEIGPQKGATRKASTPLCGKGSPALFFHWLREAAKCRNETKILQLDCCVIQTQEKVAAEFENHGEVPVDQSKYLGGGMQVDCRDDPHL